MLARLEFKLKIDDPVGAVGVHGAAAIWGVIAVGLFADSNLPSIEVLLGDRRPRFVIQIGKVVLWFLKWWEVGKTSR